MPTVDLTHEEFKTLQDIVRRPVLEARLQRPIVQRMANGVIGPLDQFFLPSALWREGNINKPIAMGLAGTWLTGADELEKLGRKFNVDGHTKGGE